MKISQKHSFVLTRVLTLAMFLIVQLGQTGAQARSGDVPLTKVFLPLFLQARTRLLVDPIWRWGDINLAPGSKGILVTDLDGDAQNEVLTAHSELLIALRATEQYRFAETWVIPMGVSWGMADIAEQGSDQVWVAYPDGRVLIYLPYTYAPLLTARLALPVGTTLQQALVADLFADTNQEFLVLTSDGDLVAYSLPRFNRVWSYRLRDTGGGYFTPMLVAQVDDDVASEIIISSGYVIDPNLSVEQWYYNDGFGSVIRAGDVDGDGRQEIVGMSDWSYITAFDVDFRTPTWQIDTSDNDTIELADVIGDATPEILLGEGQWGTIKVYDAKTQALLWSVANPEHGVSGIGVGDANNDGELDLIWGAGWTSSGADHLYLTPISRRTHTFVFPDYDGPYSATALQMDEDDALELVVFTASTNSGYDGPAYFILDSATRAEQPELRLGIDGETSYNGQWHFLTANMDGDPYQELILNIGNALYVLDHDGHRLVKRNFSEPYKPDWVGDVDGDGQLELVSHSSNRVNIHRLDTLAFEWRSISFSAGVANVAVGDVDGDGHMELVFHGPNSYLQAYDGQTHYLEWQMPRSQQASAVAIGNADAVGNLEIATIENERIVFYDGVTRAEIKRTAQLDSSGYGGTSLVFVHMTYSPYPQLVAITNNRIALFEHPYAQNPSQVLDHASATISFADTDNDHHMDLLVGDHLGVIHYRARSEFPDVIPPVAHAVTPRAGADLVARNAFVEARFNEQMNPSSMVAANAQLQVGGLLIPATLNYDTATRVLRLTPQELLPANSAVTVWLGPGLRDLAGNGLDGNLNGIGGEANDAYTWQFTTGSGVDDVGPAILNLTLSPNPIWPGMSVVVSANADDTNPAATSTVRRAEYFLDTLGAPGTGQALSAVDGRFDSRTESIRATLDTTGWSGSRVIYVRAEDSVGNWGTIVSATLEIQAESVANWPQFGQNAAHTSYHPSQARVSGFTAAWEADLAALFNNIDLRPLAQVAVANGLVVANVDPVGVIALRVTDGSELWRYSFSGKHSVNPPSIAYGTVYFQQGNHWGDTYLFALNALTGQEVWRSSFDAQWEKYFAPTVADGRVFINGGYYGGMYAFDAFDGNRLWFVDLPQYDEWTPAYQDNVVYSWVAGVLKAWDPQWGTEQWSAEVGWDWRGWSMGRIAALSTTTAYVVANSSAGADLVAIDLTTHAEKWRKTGAFTVSVAVTENEVYGLDGTKLRVFDANTGAELWSYDAGVPLINSPVVTAGNVYFAATDHTWVLDRATHALVWETNKGGWLTVANDQLFIAQQNGKLAVFNAQR